MNILSAVNLTKTFKKPTSLEILSGVSLEINEGESIAITGKSGAGKTTLLHVLGTLEGFDSGELLISGKPVTNVQASQIRSERIGFIFQAFNLLEDFTTLENVLMPARISRKSFDRKHGLDLLSLIGLESRADYPVKLLSGGERQRVAIARALCNNPDLLFADEPAGNLDAANAEAVNHLLFELVRMKKKTLILVTHDMDTANRCSRKFTLSSGKLLVS